MRIRLISHPPVPVMLFSISFIPTDLHSLPPNWDSQLAILSTADLEQPRSVYALDSSAWLTEILEEVTFDVVSLTVSAVFIDGHTEDWPLMDRACIHVLEDVLDDLRRTFEPPTPSLPPAPPSTPISSVFKKPAKHKKQRSLLMQFVHSLIPNSVSAAQLPLVAPPLPPPPPPSCQQSAEDAMYKFLTASKELRQRARSGLLDAYRRFVVQELKSRLPSSGYTIWIAESTLRRTEEHMARLAEYAVSTVSLPLPEFSFDCQTATVPEDLFAYDDDAASETASLSRTVGTESDSSSVHTPDSTCAFRRGTPAAFTLSDPDAEAFAALSRRALQIREHLVRAANAQRNAAADDTALLAIAEVRGRRRAWLNRQLRGGAHLSDIGFATPVRSSQLVRHTPLSAANLAASQLSSQIGSPRLFPVVEDCEEELDLWTPMDKVTNLIPVRQPTQVRVRTRSVRHLRGPPGLGFDLECQGAIELGPPVLVVPQPAATPFPYSSPTVVTPIPEHELDLELGTVGVAFANGKGVEYECGEWLPGIQLGTQ